MAIVPRRACLAGIFCGALTACAPPADFRPPSALVFEDRRLEVGTGLVHVSRRPYVDESSRDIGQSWATVRATRWLSLSAISAYDTNGVLGGVAALFRVVQRDRVVLGTSAEAGYAWGGLSLSGAFRFIDDSWIYVAPRAANWGDQFSLGIPFGLSVRVTGGFHLRTEAQWSWADLKYYNRRLHSGIAAAYDF
ncbi:MAG TPA: hypothetical protein VHE30_13725 [Polyangiaceae bacterium]|nr:hypothetical protein [Polyangiaceae bacterium]